MEGTTEPLASFRAHSLGSASSAAEWQPEKLMEYTPDGRLSVATTFEDGRSRPSARFGQRQLTLHRGSSIDFKLISHATMEIMRE